MSYDELLPSIGDVWWKDDDCWVEYSPQHARLIKQALQNNELTVEIGRIYSEKYSQVHPSGPIYTVDLKAMEQMNTVSGFRRKIHIVDADEEEYDDFEVRVSTVDGIAYTDADVKSVLVAAAIGDTKVALEAAGSKGSHVTANLATMRAEDTVGSCFFRNRVVSSKGIQVEMVSNPGVVKAVQDGNKSLQKEVLKGVLNRFMDMSYIEEKHDGVVDSIDLYDVSDDALLELVNALISAIGRNKEKAGMLVDVLIEGEEAVDEELLVVKYAFHKVPQGDNIMGKGIMDKKYEKVELTNMDLVQFDLPSFKVVASLAVKDKFLPFGEVNFRH